jgi:hypothetical protein
VKRMRAKLSYWARSVSRWIVEQILADGPALRQARRAIQSHIEDATDRSALDAERLQHVADGLTEDDIRRYMTIEMDRRKSVEDKAKINLLGITIAVTVLFASPNFVGKKELNAAMGGLWGIGALALLTIGVGYLLYGGLKALDALQIAKIYSPSPEEESGVCERLRKANLLWCLEQNKKAIFLRTNAVSVSYLSIRNGVFILAVLLVLLATRMLIFLWAQ